MQNDDTRGIDGQPEERVAGVPDGPATPLCMHCLEPTDPHTYYCPNCQSNDAVNPLVTYLPFEGLRFTYGAVAKVWGWLVPRELPLLLQILLSLGFLFAWPVLMPLMVVFWIVDPDRVRWYSHVVVIAIAAAAVAGYATVLLSHIRY